MRLIDADELKRELSHAIWLPEWEHIRDKVLEDIDMQPTVDAVEVVRCKDCIVHNKCCTEDTFKFAGIKNPFCCAGKKVQE